MLLEYRLFWVLISFSLFSSKGLFDYRLGALVVDSLRTDETENIWCTYSCVDLSMGALVPFFLSLGDRLGFNVVARIVFFLSFGGDKKRREASNRKPA
jgi:hypothetical protein